MNAELAASRHPYYVRNLHEMEPDDFEYPAWDVVIALPGGQFVFSNELADTIEEATGWFGDESKFDDGTPGAFVKARHQPEWLLAAVVENRKKVAEWCGLHYGMDFPKLAKDSRRSLERRFFELHSDAAAIAV